MNSIQTYINEEFKDISNDELIKKFNKYKNSPNFDPTGCCLLIGELSVRNIIYKI